MEDTKMFNPCGKLTAKGTPCQRPSNGDRGCSKHFERNQVLTSVDPKFEKAFQEMPECAMGNYDPLEHKTVEDLVFCAQHELDMYEEGEETDISTTRQVKQVRAFIAKWGKGGH